MVLSIFNLENTDKILKLIREYKELTNENNNFYIIPEKNYYNYGTLLHIVCGICKNLEIIQEVASFCPAFNIINS